MPRQVAVRYHRHVLPRKDVASCNAVHHYLTAAITPSASLFCHYSRRPATSTLPRRLHTAKVRARLCHALKYWAMPKSRFCLLSDTLRRLLPCHCCRRLRRLIVATVCRAWPCCSTPLNLRPLRYRLSTCHSSSYHAAQIPPITTSPFRRADVTTGRLLAGHAGFADAFIKIGVTPLKHGNTLIWRHYCHAGCRWADVSARPGRSSRSTPASFICHHHAVAPTIGRRVKCRFGHQRRVRSSACRLFAGRRGHVTRCAHVHSPVIV